MKNGNLIIREAMAEILTELEVPFAFDSVTGMFSRKAAPEESAEQLDKEHLDGPPARLAFGSTGA